MSKYYEGISRDVMLARLVNDYLTKTGWLRSVDKKESVNNIGPIPWYTYSAIRMLEKIITHNMKVYEYGAGNSSIWWAAHVDEVFTVEHELDWYKETIDLLGNSNKLKYIPPDFEVGTNDSGHLKEFFDELLHNSSNTDTDQIEKTKSTSLNYYSYATELLSFPKGYFDVVIIDGRARVLSTWIAIKHLDDSGLLIFDNSDRDAYQIAYNLLREAGYARIDFWGPGPINPYEWCTSIFTKDLRLFKEV